MNVEIRNNNTDGVFDVNIINGRKSTDFAMGSTVREAVEMVCTLHAECDGFRLTMNGKVYAIAEAVPGQFNVNIKYI